jgi:hypothetical protein
VYLVIVFLSMILPMLLLSSKLKRNLIIAQNLTPALVVDLGYRHQHLLRKDGCSTQGLV